MKVAIYEVGPRDGLQNVAATIPTSAKIAFVDALTRAGLPAIEAASFVSPRAVPQLADGGDVLRGIARREGVRYPVLVPNMKGLESALALGVREVAVFTAASDEFNRRNIQATHAEAMERFRPVAERARTEGVRLRGYVSMAFGCPFQGDVPVTAVVQVTRDLFGLGCGEVSVGDTIGVADPEQVRRVVAALASDAPIASLALHLHDTWGRALANVAAGLQAGITTFDSSAGGLGGCPYAPGATGNVATEDVVSLLDRLGVETGVSLRGVAEASLALHAATGLELPSRALAAWRATRARS